MNKALFFVLLMNFPVFAQGQDIDGKTTAPDGVPVFKEAVPVVKEEMPVAQENARVVQAGTKESTIHLRTTVMGNQEQPQVMYILPWQSPLSPELEMDMLGSEADAVFGHLERDELQRNLEAAGELDVKQ